MRDWRFSNSLAHTDLTSRADFGAFVFPPLSVGPRGNHDIELIAENETKKSENSGDLGDSTAPAADRYGYASVFRRASLKGAGGARETDGEAPPTGVTMTREIKLAPNQTMEIEVPLTGGSRASIIFLASPTLSARLLDSSGQIIGRNSASTPESKQIFRTIAIEKTISGGPWKLKLESFEQSETPVFAAAFVDSSSINFTIAAGQPSAAP